MSPKIGWEWEDWKFIDFDLFPEVNWIWSDQMEESALWVFQEQINCYVDFHKFEYYKIQIELHWERIE